MLASNFKNIFHKLNNVYCDEGFVVELFVNLFQEINTFKKKSLLVTYITFTL